MRFVSLAWFVFLATACQNPGNEAPPADPAPPATKSEWITLFDGTNLDQFRQLGEAQWNIVDDYVEADGYKFSYLSTKEHFGDFRLEVEFWPSPDANSGVYIRSQNPDEIKADSGYEINIWDTNENPDGRTGAIINFSAPLEEIVTGDSGTSTRSPPTAPTSWFV